MGIESQNSRPQVVFIAGLTHSGSTLLDILLGKTRPLVGLGEIVPLLRSESFKLQEPDRVCSCAQLVGDCPFWSQVLKRNLKSSDSFEDKYRQVLETFHDVFGPERVPVDSSKSMGALRRVTAVDGIDLKVIHLIRDVRSWVVSRRDVDRRRNREALVAKRKALKGSIWRDNVYARFLIWYFGNKRIINFTDEVNLRRVNVGYETLVFETDSVISFLLDGLSMPSRPQMSESQESGSHILLGNRMRLKKDNDIIRYDYRWLTRREWRIPALMLPRIMDFNTEWVYGTDRRTKPASDKMVMEDQHPLRIMEN